MIWLDKRKWRAFAFAAIALGFVLAGGERGWAAFPPPLTVEQAAQLSNEARALYQQALADADRIRYDAALQKLARAAALDKDHAALQFLNAGAQRDRAEGKLGDEARQLFGRALESLDRVTSSSLTDAAQFDRATRERAAIIERMTGIADRDAQRGELGKTLRRAYARSGGAAPAGGGGVARSWWGGASSYGSPYGQSVRVSVDFSSSSSGFWGRGWGSGTNFSYSGGGSHVSVDF